MQHFHFRDFVDTLDYLEVCRVTIRPDGGFAIPNEKDGKVAQVSPKTRKALASFLREFADRLECPDPKHLARPARMGLGRAAGRTGRTRAAA